MIELIQPASGKPLVVSPEHVDFWRARGYHPRPAEKPKRRKAAAS